MAEEFVLGAITGAIASALLDEVIAMARNAYRCKESCDNLLSTLKSVKPLLDDVGQSVNTGNITCYDWLNTMYALLVKTRYVLRKCVCEGIKIQLSTLHV